MTLNKNFFILATLISLLFFSKPEIYSIIFLILIMIFLGSQSKKDLLQILNFTYPLIILIIVGLIFFMNNTLYEAFKDVWLISKIFIVYVLGSFLYKVSKKIDIIKIINLIITIGLFNSLLWLCLVYANIINENNYVSGPIGSIPILIIALLPIYIISKSNHKIAKLSSIFILICAITFSYSRLRILYFFISIFLFLKLNNPKSYLKKSNLYIFLIIISIVPISIGFLPEQTLNKFKNYSNELTYDQGDNILQHWRAFENSKAIDQFMSYPLSSKIFGNGHGALLDLNVSIEISTGGTDTYQAEKLPVIHNGYLMVMLKTGVMGLFLYLFFIYKIAFLSLGKNVAINCHEERKLIDILTSFRKSLFFIILIGTFFTSGLFNKGS